MKKRLLKDLPFSNLESGDVIYRGSRGFGGEFSISLGKTFYAEGGTSDRGLQGFNDKEEEILKMIWNDPQWFEDAVLKHIEIIPTTKSIVLRFKSLDIDDAETLAMGIIHILPELSKGSYIWNKFVDITTEIKNS